jgi:tetratricopeptide (TPR) repeat protein
VLGLEHLSAASAKGRFAVLVMVMAVATLISGLEAVALLNWAPLLVALGGWAFVLVYGALEGVFSGRAGRVVGALTLPSGEATPSVNQHSNIQAMVARGACAQAAEAYRAAIAADPADVVACELLGQLALAELKDGETALYAFREAERRAREPRRQLGYALLVAGVYRDTLQDPGRAAVELRRVLARYPDAPNAEALRAELDRLKTRHFEGA